jgi:hypothetical protein
VAGSQSETAANWKAKPPPQAEASNPQLTDKRGPMSIPRAERLKRSSSEK